MHPEVSAVNDRNVGGADFPVSGAKVRWPPSGTDGPVSKADPKPDFKSVTLRAGSVLPLPRMRMIHILFCSSAAGTLRQALRARHRRERVVDLTEHLDWGFIGSGDFQERADWFDRNVPSSFKGGWAWIVEHVSEFTRQVGKSADRTIWCQPDSARELSGLHWYLERFGGSNAQMLIAPPFESISGLGVRGLESMGDLLDNCPRVRWDDKRFPEGLWNNLVADNSFLRIVNNGVLQSVPSNYFDHHLLGCCPTVWTEWIRVVGNAMTDLQDAGHCVDDLFLQWRLAELIRCDAVASKGKLPRYGEQSRTLVRLAS